MKKCTLILTLMLALLILSGCKEKEGLPVDDKVDDTVKITRANETSAVPADEELVGLMGLEEEQIILSRHEQDYDGSGKYQAFISVGNADDSSEGENKAKELWFYSDGSTEQLLDSYELVIYGDHIFGDDKLFVASESYATGDLVSFYHVKDGSVNVDKISRAGGGFEQTSSTEMTLYHSVTDMAVFGGGRTWKRYWFYWDEDSDCFREYGGTEIDTLSIKDTEIKRVINEIEHDGGTVEKVLYRSNDVININYIDGEAYKNFSLKKDGQSWVPITIWEDSTDEFQRCVEGGRYLDALVPRAAVYPEDDALSSLTIFPESDNLT